MTTFEEQFADLFGKTPDGKKVGGGSGQYIKYATPGETYYLVQTGDLTRTPQTIKVDGVDKVKVLVRVKQGEKMKPFAKDAVPEGTQDKDVWQPPGDVEIPVKVVKHLHPNGAVDEEFEPFETMWELKAGNRMEKLEEAMLENRALTGAGTKYIEKLLSNSTKPYKYAIKMKPAEDSE